MLSIRRLPTLCRESGVITSGSSSVTRTNRVRLFGVYLLRAACMSHAPSHLYSALMKKSGSTYRELNATPTYFIFTLYHSYSHMYVFD